MTISKDQTPQRHVEEKVPVKKNGKLIPIEY